MVLSAITIVFTVCVINIHHRDPDHHPTPPWVKKYILGHLARFMRIAQKKTKGSDIVEGNGNSTGVEKGEESSPFLGEKIPKGENVNDWIITARVLDRFFMILYLLMAIMLTAGVFSVCLGAEMHRRHPIGDYGYLTEEYRQYTRHPT